eukprot:804247-Prorocentrum_minimum.AAC.6
MVLIYYVMLPHRGEQVRDGRAGVGAVYARGSVRLHRAGELQVLQPREDHEPGAYHGARALDVPGCHGEGTNWLNRLCPSCDYKRKAGFEQVAHCSSYCSAIVEH